MEELPKDILTTCFKLLDVATLCVAEQVCSRWRKVIQAERIWDALWNECPVEQRELVATSLSFNTTKDLVLWYKLHYFSWDLSPYQTGQAFRSEGLRLYKQDRAWRPILGTPGWTRGIHYWEVLLVDVEHKNNVQLGVASFAFGTVNSEFDFSVSKLSWGIYGYDGQVLSCGKSVDRVPRWKDGDTIGLLLNMHTKTLAYYHNGKYLGELFHDIDTSQRLYPAFCLDRPDVCIELKFAKIPKNRMPVFLF